MSPADSIRYLFSLLGSIRKANFGLFRMKCLMAELGNPDQVPGIVHIAGTNGKGSTAAMIESGLRAAGHSTGLYTSPHLSRINERFLLDGKMVSDAALAAAIEPVRHANERVVAQHGHHAHPTFFESVTAVALVLFNQAEVDYKVVETGLGGRLDASNVVRPEVAVITRVERDHERFLGRDVGQIAAEKGAIVKRGCRAVVGRQARAARDVLLRRCVAEGVDFQDVESDWLVRDARSESGFWRFDAIGPSRTVNAELALAGEHQIENSLAAIAALDTLGTLASRIEAGLRQTRWPGRLEVASRSPLVLLDAAHNPGGARALALFLRREASGRRVTLVFGASRDKAVDEIASWIFPAADRVLLTRSNVTRAASPQALLQAVGHHHARIETAESVGRALQVARADAASQDWIVVAGSVFLVGEARELLG